jgi:hypothetical protein
VIGKKSILSGDTPLSYSDNTRKIFSRVFRNNDLKDDNVNTSVMPKQYNSGWYR